MIDKIKSTDNTVDTGSLRVSIIKPALMLIFMLNFCISAMAEEPRLLESLTDEDLSQLTGLSGYNVSMGGWLTSGFTYNPSEPKNHSNGTVQFNNRANEYNLYQLGLFVENPIGHNVKTWQLGGRFEFMFGTDTPNTQALGHWDSHLISPKGLGFYDIAFPQAYLEIFAPFGNGISAKIGHFYSIIGYESVASPPNLFVSHSYSMKSSPFTMSGVLASYQVNDLLTVQAGAVTGPDNVDQHGGAWGFIGGFSLDNKAHTSGFTFSVLDGDVDDTFPSHLTYAYAMLHHDFMPKLHYVLQHDYGDQTRAVGIQDAEWYSIANYLTYDINSKWSAGLRVEWFHDDDGTRFLSTPGSYYEISIGANWKPLGWFTLRPEIRYDWADGPKPFDVQTTSNQLLVAIDSVIVF